MAAFVGIYSLEQRAASGESLKGIESVASFVSRVDTEVDHRLGEAAAHDKDLTDDVARLQGQAGIANSRLAYEVYERMLQSPRWKALAAKGAKPQRLLWVSTGVKDKSFPDTRYVVELVAPDTVNTMSEATLHAVADHGEVRGNTIRGSYAAAHAVMDDVRRVGVNLSKVAELRWTPKPMGSTSPASGSGDMAAPAAAAPSHTVNVEIDRKFGVLRETRALPDPSAMGLFYHCLPKTVLAQGGRLDVISLPEEMRFSFRMPLG